MSGKSLSKGDEGLTTESGYLSADSFRTGTTEEEEPSMMPVESYTNPYVDKGLINEEIVHPDLVDFVARCQVIKFVGSTDPQRLNIVIIHCGNVTSGSATVHEIAFCLFTIEEGLLDSFQIAIEEGLVRNMTSSELESETISECETIVSKMQKFLDKCGRHRRAVNHENKPYVFCLESQMNIVKRSLKTLYSAAGTRYTDHVQVGSLGELMKRLTFKFMFSAAFSSCIPPLDFVCNIINKCRKNFGIVEGASNFDSRQNDSVLSVIEDTRRNLTDEQMGDFWQFKNTCFLFNLDAEEVLMDRADTIYEELACEDHMKEDMDVYMQCPLHMVNRFAYKIIQSFIPYTPIIPVVGIHSFDPENEAAKRNQMLAKWNDYYSQLETQGENLN